MDEIEAIAYILTCNEPLLFVRHEDIFHRSVRYFKEAIETTNANPTLLSPQWYKSYKEYTIYLKDTPLCARHNKIIFEFAKGEFILSIIESRIIDGSADNVGLRMEVWSL